MDCVHDTLADGRPFRVLTVVDNWSRHSPVREAGFRMSGERVGIMARNSNHERGKSGPIGAVCRSTSFDPANRWRMPSLSRVPADCATSV